MDDKPRYYCPLCEQVWSNDDLEDDAGICPEFGCFGELVGIEPDWDDIGEAKRL